MIQSVNARRKFLQRLQHTGVTTTDTSVTTDSILQHNLQSVPIPHPEGIVVQQQNADRGIYRTT